MFYFSTSCRRFRHKDRQLFLGTNGPAKNNFCDENVQKVNKNKTGIKLENLYEIGNGQTIMEFGTLA